MKVKFLSALLLFSALAFGFRLAPALGAEMNDSDKANRNLPLISLEAFPPGQSWIWNYTQGAEFFSSERYVVMSRDSEYVWIEMSTKLPGESVYRAHHRIHVSIKKCLAAYRGSGLRKAWSFDMYYLNGGNWEIYDPSNTLAFEEKFNCNPHLNTNRTSSVEPYLTVFHPFEKGTELFEQKPWGKLNSSRYILSGPRAAIAAEKIFAKRDGRDYKFELEMPQTN